MKGDSIKKVGRKLLTEPAETLNYIVRSYTENEVKGFFDEDAKETRKLSANQKKSIIW